MKTYKQRYKEMNQYYLDRIHSLQERERERIEAGRQIDRMYQGYIVELIRNYGLPDGTAVINLKNVDLNEMILVSLMDDGRMRLKIVNVEEGV